MTARSRAVVVAVLTAAFLAFFVAMLADLLAHKWLAALVMWGMSVFSFLAAWIVAAGADPYTQEET